MPDTDERLDLIRNMVGEVTNEQLREHFDQLAVATDGFQDWNGLFLSSRFSVSHR